MLVCGGGGVGKMSGTGMGQSSDLSSAEICWFCDILGSGELNLGYCENRGEKVEASVMSLRHT